MRIQRGLLDHRQLRVGVLPDRQQIRVDALPLRRVARENERPGQLQARHRSHGIDEDDASMIDNALELGGSSAG